MIRDAALIAAEAELRQLLDEGGNLDEDEPAPIRRRRRIGECMAIVNRTSPMSLARCAAKLRVVLANGDAGDRDTASLRQILAFVERQARNEAELLAQFALVEAELGKGKSLDEAVEAVMATHRGKAAAQ